MSKRAVASPVASYLQRIEWTMSSGSSASSVVSEGLDIIAAAKTSQLNISANTPRLWNGTEGGTFASGVLCREWWDGFEVVAFVNGGAEESLGNPLSGNAQPSYINATTSLSSLQAGDVIVFEVRAAA